MKRIHLFEFEDQAWFPDWIRVLMTRYTMTFHRMLGTADLLLPLVKRGLQYTDTNVILDLCSGSGGPMIEVAQKLRKSQEFEDLKLILSDLYPNQSIITINFPHPSSFILFTSSFIPNLKSTLLNLKSTPPLFLVYPVADGSGVHNLPVGWILRKRLW